jgi:hypothetical protein
MVKSFANVKQREMVIRGFLSPRECQEFVSFSPKNPVLACGRIGTMGRMWQRTPRLAESKAARDRLARAMPAPALRKYAWSI